MNDKKKGISRILQITKKLIKTQKNFLGYMFKDNNDLIKEQLPILLPNIRKYHKKDLKNCRLTKSTSCNNFYSFPKTIDFLRYEKKKKIKIIKRQINTKSSYSSKTISKISNNIFGRHRLVNDILFDTSENKNENDYDERNIFYSDKDFIKRINDNISFIIKNINNYKNNLINDPPYSLTKLSKIFHQGSEREINLSLSSIYIKFKAQKEPKYKKKFYLPFFLAPLFFYNSEINIPKILLTLFKFNEDFTEVFFERNDELYNFIPNNENYTIYEKKFNKIYHTYKFIWITNAKIFEVEVKMPLIQLIVSKTKTFINKYIDVKLFSFLFSQDMLNWDFFLTNYLFSFKSFRKIIDSITSKVKTKNQILYINKKIQMSENRIRENNLSDKNALFFFTNHENKNYLLTLNPMYLEVLVNENSERNKIFNFTIGEFLSIIESSKFIEPFELLNKFIKYNSITGEIKFDYKNFNSVKEENLKTMLKYQNKNIDDSLSSNSDEEENNNNIKKVFLTKTSITLQSLYNGVLVEKDNKSLNYIKYDAKISLLKTISFSKNLNEWGDNLKLLLENLKKNLNYKLFLKKNVSYRNGLRQSSSKRISITPIHNLTFKTRTSTSQIPKIKKKFK